MSSSSQSLSPVQWLFSQAYNNFGSELNKEDIVHSHSFDCGCSVSSATSYRENKNSVINLDFPQTQGLKVINSSGKTLQDILNISLFNKPFIIWNTNTVDNTVLSNCIDLKESSLINNTDYQQSNLQTHFISSDQIPEKNTYIPSYSGNALGYKPTLKKIKPSTVFQVCQGRMVTSSLGSNNVSCNIHPQVDKKKLKIVGKQTFTNNSYISTNNKTSNSKIRDTSLKCSEPIQILPLEAKHTASLNYHDDKGRENKLSAINGSAESNAKLECVKNSLDKDGDWNNSKHGKGTELEEVGKILENVLWTKRTIPNQKRSDCAVADNPNRGGSDTGYSSRCSTPPASGNLAESISDEEKISLKEKSSQQTFSLKSENNRESRSQSPSDCSESSYSSYQPPRNKCRFQNQPNNSYYNQSQKPPQNHFVPFPLKVGGDESFNYQRFNGSNRLRGGQVNNNTIRNNAIQPGYRKVERIAHAPFTQGYTHLSQQNSSHYVNEYHNAGKPTYGSNGLRHFNQGTEVRNNNPNNNSSSSWGYNQKYQNGKNRQYGNTGYNQFQNFQSNGYRSNPNYIYYQLNSQYDLRETVGCTQRKLRDPAGAFSSDNGNQSGRWRIDHRAEATIIPPELLVNSEWDALSQQVWSMFSKHQQLDSTFKAKMELKDRICRVIWNVLPMCRLFVVGSSLSGFGANSSDVDMCLMVTPRDLDQRNEAQAVLRLLQRELNNCGFVEKMELITAKVPILKFRDSNTGIDIDLNCNNSVGIRNTHLLNAYSQLDWRVRPLVLVVKLWAQHHHINNAKDMTISSYSLVLMVIHYLQCGLETPLLPCLHRAYPDKFNSCNHVFKMPVTERLPMFVSNNHQTLGELFLGFLEYFTVKFTFIKNAMSVRTGGTIPTEDCRYVRTRKNDSRMWKYLCIEEPFDLTNTARSVYDEVVFEKVKNVFKASYVQLKATKDLTTIFSS